MVELKAHSVEIEGKAWNTVKAHYPDRPTVFSGVEIDFGADSCLDHPEPSTARLSMWLPKRYADWVPVIGEEIKITASIGSSSPAPIFGGRVDSVVIQDNHKPAPSLYQPQNMLDYWQSMTETTGWTFKLSDNGAALADITSSVTLEGNNAFRVPVKANTASQQYRIYSPRFAVTREQSYHFTVGNSPYLLAGWSYLYVRQFNGAGSLISTTTYQNPSDKGSFVATPSTTHAEFEYLFNMHFVEDRSIIIGDFKLWKMFSDAPLGEDPAGFRIDINCSDAVAAAGRLRLGDKPWQTERALVRMGRVAELASTAGVAFKADIDTDQGYSELSEVRVRARDVDSANALEVFQDTVMSGGQTVGSIDNIVQPNYRLRLAKLLSQSGDVTTCSWLGAPHKSKSVMKRNDVEFRRNEVVNPQGEESENNFVMTNYAISGGTGSSTYQSRTFDRPRRGTSSIRGLWKTGGTSIGGVYYRDPNVSGVAGEYFSGGVWVRYSESGEANVTITLRSASTTVRVMSTTAIPVVAGEWQWYPFSLIASGPFDSFQVWPRMTTPMPTGATQDLDGILVERTAEVREYFDGFSAGNGGVIVTELKSRSGREIPVIPIGAIEDSSFSMDTTEVVNQMRIDFFRDNNNTPLIYPDEAYLEVGHMVEEKMVFSAAGPNQSVTQRVLKGENVIYQSDAIPPTPMPLDAVDPLRIRAETALAAQSHPRWRLTNGVTLVLKALPDHSGLVDLIEEAGRFGQLIKITGTNEMVDEYYRIRSGRIVLGDDAQIEYEVEPIDYSGPTALSRNSAYHDTLTRAVTLNDLQEISSNDLRSISAR